MYYNPNAAVPSLDVNILVNGNRCKQYSHDGRIYVEAKAGSEYAIEIKNNSSGRILAIASVDGISVMSGEAANDETDNGYVIGAYSSEKIKGFRLSDTEWALFKFGYKLCGKTYAQSKNNGADVNCGVIGVSLFYEKWISFFNASSLNYIPNNNNYYWGNSVYGHSGVPIGISTNVNDTYSGNINFGGQMRSCADTGGTGEFKAAFSNNIQNTSLSYGCNVVSSAQNASPKPVEFNMGTEFGKKETSKVTTVNFEKGLSAGITTIYYADRASLISSGVPIETGLKISAQPQPFANRQYAKPPQGWTGNSY